MSTGLKVVEKVYASFSAQNDDAARELLADDVQWIQCKGFPGGGHHRGRDEVIEKVMHALHGEWNSFSATMDEVIDADHHVIVLGTYRGVHSLTGKPMEAVFAHVFDIEDGKVARFRQYADTFPMHAAMELFD
ncbi:MULTISPECIES: nuclear transport factor 2 family protein [Crateriforma]|uniref:SnoaL-like domain protein n=1 Tax=Crateriforma conspicua TaxID=2527996 RepID=A0A5C6FI03_9PLAN|nr:MULTISPECIES: nuclear transport factor 2 family protein [Crateriforma]TWU61657.1 SnoaL-like domain protein [Crateriforma conspicua]